MGAADAVVLDDFKESIVIVKPDGRRIEGVRVIFDAMMKPPKVFPGHRGRGDQNQTLFSPSPPLPVNLLGRFLGRRLRHAAYSTSPMQSATWRMR
jgi:hypothetical protein